VKSPPHLPPSLTNSGPLQSKMLVAEVALKNVVHSERQKSRNPSKAAVSAIARSVGSQKKSTKPAVRRHKSLLCGVSPFFLFNVYF